MLKKRRVLVTGGAGFIGANLCRRLLEENCRVICLDNFYTSSQKNIERIFDHPNFQFVGQDVINSIAIEADEIYHLAAPASPVHYRKNPIYTAKTIFLGTLNALECARKNKAKILVSSTSEIYGEPAVHPQKEDYLGNVNPTGERACYNESKRCSETLCADYRRVHGLDVKIVRVFNTYGPYMAINDGRVVSEFTVRMLTGQSLYINGGGTQTRSFCYIDDLVEGLMAMMKSDAPGPVNLGVSDEITINQLVGLLATITGISPIFHESKMPKDDPTRRQPDLTLARDLLNWNPTIGLREGLTRTVEYFRQVLEAEGCL